MHLRQLRPLEHCLAAAVIGAFIPCAAGAQPSLVRISLGPAGVQGADNSFAAAISADGRWAAFASWADNLVPGDTNGAQDIFVRDLRDGTTTRVSVATGGVEASFSSYDPDISADGRWVVFETASPLGLDDKNDATDIYAHDRTTGMTVRVSVATGGRQGSQPSYGPAISADGRWVAFNSDNPFVADDTNDVADVFVHDLQTGVTIRLSVGTGGAQGNAQSVGACISADGRWVAFASAASNLVAPDWNGEFDMFLHDRVTATTTMVRLGPGGQLSSPTRPTAISADARWMLFSSLAGDIVPADTNGFTDVFVYDRLTDTTARINVGPGGIEANGESSAAGLSADGRWVVFNSLATNLAPGDANGVSDVFVYDQQTGATTRVSVAAGGAGAEGNAASIGGSVSVDGRAMFSSVAGNLVPDDTNDRSDVFVYAPGTGLCGITLAPSQASVPAGGAEGQVLVLAAASCGWTASAGADWLSVTGAGSEIGFGIVRFRVAANIGAARSAALLIGGVSFLVDQVDSQTPAAPTRLVVQSVAGARVTLAWRVDPEGPRPTQFVVEGGTRPGESMVSVPTGSNLPMFVVDVPAGWFYARVRALNGSIPGAPSNEVRVFVNAPVAPSAPANLLALVDGSTVTLTWTPTFEGGAPTSFALEVAGATVATVPAGLVDHTTVAGVLPGTYRVAVRALNDSGHSERSNTVTLTIPAACPGAPAVPVDVRVNRSGRRVSIYWTPGPTGPAPIAYAVIVTGSTLGSVATTERTLSGALGPGTYALSVVAVTPCGVSAGSPPLAILVP